MELSSNTISRCRVFTSQEAKKLFFFQYLLKRLTYLKDLRIFPNCSMGELTYQVDKSLFNSTADKTDTF